MKPGSGCPDPCGPPSEERGAAIVEKRKTLCLCPVTGSVSYTSFLRLPEPGTLLYGLAEHVPLKTTGMTR